MEGLSWLGECEADWMGNEASECRAGWMGEHESQLIYRHIGPLVVTLHKFPTGEVNFSSCCAQVNDR